MTRPTALRALILASLVFASGAHAGNNEIQKCVTGSGHVTLTDDACPSGTQSVKVISGPETDDEQVAAPAPRAERNLVPRMPVRYVAPLKGSTPTRGMALDASTLRAARANMQMVDHATASLRQQQRLAALQ